MMVATATTKAAAEDHMTATWLINQQNMPVK
jgi:hypothetical protein